MPRGMERVEIPPATLTLGADIILSENLPAIVSPVTVGGDGFQLALLRQRQRHHAPGYA